MLTALTLLTFSCKKDKSTLSEVETYTPEFVASNATTIMCHVTSDGGTRILDCGIYIGTEAGTEINGSKLQMGNDTGLWFGRLTGLTPATEYFLRAYSENANGETLGDEVSFTTPARVSDFDGTEYETVKIGNQLWMAENLKVTHYLNGDPIETTTPATLNMAAESAPAYMWSYQGIDANLSDYGELYTWYVISDQDQVCPDGWHIPSDNEWTTLETVLGGYLNAGSYLKEAGNDHWILPYNQDANNISCFTALPGGHRDETGSFNLIYNEGYWWSATASETTKAWARKMNTSSSEVSRIGVDKKWGVSVRCVKDN